MREFLRWYGMLNAWILQLAFFKRKTYYEDKSVQGRYIKGGALVVSNHFHVFDYMMTAYAVIFRKLYVVMRSDVAQTPFKKWIMSIFGGILSDRDVNGMKFVDESVSLLRKGRVVQIFPEAYITTDGNMRDFKYGYIMIAQRADKPIIPIISDGNYGWLKRTHIIIGKPILLSDYCPLAYPSKEDIAELNSIVYNKCVELKAELDRRIAEDKKRGSITKKGTAQ